jgi:hypothetical protein
MTYFRNFAFRRLTRGVVPVLLLGNALFLFTFAPAAQDQAPATPVTIAAGSDWVPLNLELDIAEGSALDFSRMGLLDPPAGKHGRVIARRDGQFAFESNPGVARRFYGVNLCFGAQYLQHEEADRLAERLARLGYNTVRLHHYEGLLEIRPPPRHSIRSGSTSWTTCSTR